MNLLRQPQPSPIGHLYVIDLARGLAAFSVLFWHYQQFFYLTPGVHPLSPEVAASQPGHAALWLLYDYGYFAVQFFWLLSGFVFAAVYVSRKTATREFVVNRLARLYPLHFLTLCVIAVLQWYSMKISGQFQIIPFNDVYHFVLNIFFASFWGIQKGYSFNGPIWSVSVEVLVYGLFWATLPFLFRRGIVGPLLLAAVAWVAAYRFAGHLHLLRECVFYFFTGTAIYLVFASARNRPAILFSIAGILAIVGLATLWNSPSEPAPIAVPSLLTAVLFACCGLEAISFGEHAKRARWIGDSTYGIYLWHVPLQVAVVTYFGQHPAARSALTQPWFLVAFLVTVVALARLSFVFFEDPARKWLKQFAKPRKSPGPSVAPS